MTIHQLLLGSRPRVQLSDYLVYDLAVGGLNTAWAGIRIGSNGNADEQTGTTEFTFLEKWLESGSASDYEVKITAEIGTTFEGTSDAAATWLSCSTTRRWAITRTGVGINDRDTWVWFRDATTQEELWNAYIHLVAEKQ